MSRAAWTPTAFEALDGEWRRLCRRHRRSGLVSAWAKAEPALAHIRRLDDVIPRRKVDRRSTWAAVARLHMAGDDLAGRTLLQLLVPGMVRLAVRWRTSVEGGLDEAGWEVVTHANTYIRRLRDDSVNCSSASYVLRSVARDLGLQLRRAQAWRAELLSVAGPESVTISRGSMDTEPSAEQSYLATHEVRDQLSSAVRRRIVSPAAAQTTWLFLSGHTGSEVLSRQVDTNLTAVYRQRAAVMEHLRDQLLEAV